MSGMEFRAGLAVDDLELAEFAVRHGIRSLSAFGSVLRDDFAEDSDVDLLVEFEPGRTPGMLTLAAMEIELSELIGREVELRTYGDLSRYFRDDVRRNARQVYAA
jgi:predicted nucleotidyltransferase